MVSALKLLVHSLGGVEWALGLLARPFLLFYTGVYQHHLCVLSVSVCDDDV